MTTSLQIKNNLNNYTDISNIFKIDTVAGATAPDANKYQNINSDIKFVPIIDTNALYTLLKNTQPTGFQINGTDISTKYMCNYTKIYTRMTVSETITISTDKLYNKIVFLLQAGGSNGSSGTSGNASGVGTSPGYGSSGGSGACYIGSVDLSPTTTTITSIIINVPTNPANGAIINATITFYNNGAFVYEIKCGYGRFDTRTTAGLGGIVSTISQKPAAFSDINKYNGINGTDGTDGSNGSQNIVYNPYINIQSSKSYGNVYQPINSNYNLYGSGGKGGYNGGGNESGGQGLGCIWFVKK